MHSCIEVCGVLSGVHSDGNLTITLDNLALGVNITAGTLDDAPDDNGAVAPSTPSRKFGAFATPAAKTPANVPVCVTLQFIITFAHFLRSAAVTAPYVPVASGSSATLDGCVLICIPSFCIANFT